MRDLILSVAVIAGTYLCSVGFAIAIFRLFFPLKKKGTQPKNSLTLAYSKNKLGASSQNKIQLASLNGRR
jgi:hypothetical protein